MRHKVNDKYRLSALAPSTRLSRTLGSATVNHASQQIRLSSLDAGRLAGKGNSLNETSVVDATTDRDIEIDGPAQENGMIPSADSAYYSMSTEDEAMKEYEGSGGTPSKGRARLVNNQVVEGHATSDRGETTIAVHQSTLNKYEEPIDPPSQSRNTEDRDSEAGHHQPIRSSKREKRKSQKFLMAMSEATQINRRTTTDTPRKRGRPRKHPIPSSLSKDGDNSELLSIEVSTQEGPQTVQTDKAQEKEQVSSIETCPANPLINTLTRKRGRPPKTKPIAVLPPNDATTQSTVVHHRTNEEIQTTNAHLKALKDLLRDKNYREPLIQLKTRILGILMGKRRMALIGLDEEYQKVYQLIEQTIVAGEGNSMLVIGARGSAKTTLVETILSQMTPEHHDSFHIVRLNGFIHTDDKLALKDIWRQLGREMEVEDETMGARGNYADTLASLLALLSHPSEFSTSEGNEDRTAKSVIFVMDEFDLFVFHPRQTLLYNLFDIAQSRKAPIAVLGLTTRIDVVESLEKRVKSRFSHRYVHLSLPISFAMFRDICKSALTHQSSEIDVDTNTPITFRIQKNTDHFKTLLDAWSLYISALLDDNTIMNQLLRRIYAQSKSVSAFFAACLLPVMSLSPTYIPTATDFALNTLSPPDSKLHMLPSLSELELSLLIAAARLDIILDTDTCNFNMAYDEYTMLAGKAKLQSSASGAAALGGGSRMWGKEVSLGAWERLEVLEFLVPVFGVGGGGGGVDVGRAGKLWKIDVGLEEIGASGVEMSSVMVKWCREI